MEFNIQTLVKCLKINQITNEELKENAKYLGQVSLFIYRFTFSAKSYRIMLL